MVQYFVTSDEEKEGCEFLIPVIEGYLDENGALDKHGRAYLYNQISMLQRGAEDYEGSLTAVTEALRLNPDEHAYWYNISIIYEDLGRIYDASDAAMNSIKEQTPDVDHLAHAIEIFTKAGRTDDASSAKERLKRMDPARAAHVSRATVRRGDG